MIRSLLSQALLTSSVYRAGDFDAILPGSYGDNIPSTESSRELIPLLQKLIRIIGESGPLTATQVGTLIGGTSTGLITGAGTTRPDAIGGDFLTIPVPKGTIIDCL